MCRSKFLVYIVYIYRPIITYIEFVSSACGNNTKLRILEHHENAQLQSTEQNSKSYSFEVRWLLTDERWYSMRYCLFFTNYDMISETFKRFIHFIKVKVTIPLEYQNTVATKSSWTKETRGLKIESRDSRIGVILGAEKSNDASEMVIFPDDILGTTYRPFSSTQSKYMCMFVCFLLCLCIS